MKKAIYQDPMGTELQISKSELNISVEDSVCLTYQLSKEDIMSMILDLNNQLNSDDQFIIEKTLLNKLKDRMKLKNYE